MTNLCIGFLCNVERFHKVVDRAAYRLFHLVIVGKNAVCKFLIMVLDVFKIDLQRDFIPLDHISSNILVFSWISVTISVTACPQGKLES